MSNYIERLIKEINKSGKSSEVINYLQKVNNKNANELIDTIYLQRKFVDGYFSYSLKLEKKLKSAYLLLKILFAINIISIGIIIWRITK